MCSPLVNENQRINVCYWKKHIMNLQISTTLSILLSLSPMSNVTSDNKRVRGEEMKEELPKIKNPRKPYVRHPSGHRSKKKQKLWEGEKGLRHRGETDYLLNHWSYRRWEERLFRGMVPDGLKWVEIDAPGAGHWAVYFEKPRKKPPKSSSRRLWEEFTGTWTKCCGCGGDDEICYMNTPGVTTPYCSIFM